MGTNPDRMDFLFLKLLSYGPEGEGILYPRYLAAPPAALAWQSTVGGSAVIVPPVTPAGPPFGS